MEASLLTGARFTQRSPFSEECADVTDTPIQCQFSTVAQSVESHKVSVYSSTNPTHTMTSLDTYVRTCVMYTNRKHRGVHTYVRTLCIKLYWHSTKLWSLGFLSGRYTATYTSTVEYSCNKLLYNKFLDITKQWPQPCATAPHGKLFWYNKFLLITNSLTQNTWFVTYMSVPLYIHVKNRQK